jgi:hypothetical protein
MIHERDLINFLNAALECSIYHAPTDPGLTYDELVEVGKKVGFQEGEIGDAIGHVTTQYWGGGQRKIQPKSEGAMWGLFVIRQDPDYRNYEALDLIMSELNGRVRAVGGNAAQVERSVIVENANMKGIPRIETEAAITILLLTGLLTEQDGLLRFRHGVLHLPLPSEQRANAVGAPTRSAARQRAYDLVKDVIARRTDGRPRHAEPLDAFADALDGLNYHRFRLWWTQTVSEFRRSDTQFAPLSALVLAVALVEGALSFVVKHARSRKLGPFLSTDFDKDPRTWKIDDLVNSAAAGRDAAIFDAAIKTRVEALVRSRQRIHAGRMLSEFPNVVPDLRPEEAREAKIVTELVVRRVLDWLQKYP